MYMRVFVFTFVTIQEQISLLLSLRYRARYARAGVRARDVWIISRRHSCRLLQLTVISSRGRDAHGNACRQRHTPTMVLANFAVVMKLWSFSQVSRLRCWYNFCPRKCTGKNSTWSTQRGLVLFPLNVYVCCARMCLSVKCMGSLSMIILRLICVWCLICICRFSFFFSSCRPPRYQHTHTRAFILPGLYIGINGCSLKTNENLEVSSDSPGPKVDNGRVRERTENFVADEIPARGRCKPIKRLPARALWFVLHPDVFAAEGERGA